MRILDEHFAELRQKLATASGDPAATTLALEEHEKWVRATFQTSLDIEHVSRLLTDRLVGAVENAVLRAFPIVGRGNKNAIDLQACDAIRGACLRDGINATVINGEGLKDNAPTIKAGEQLGIPDAPCLYTLALAIDPIDGTRNAASGKPNAGSYIGGVLALGQVDPYSLMSSRIVTDRCFKLVIGPHAAWPDPIEPAAPLAEILAKMAWNRDVGVADLRVVVLNREYNGETIAEIREAGCEPTLIDDGDIAPVVATCLSNESVDAYMGIGGTPELLIAAPAVRTMGGVLWARQYAKTTEETEREGYDPHTLYSLDDLVKNGDTITIFVGAGLTDSLLVKGIVQTPDSMITESVSIRSKSRTLRLHRAIHNLDKKRIYSALHDREVKIFEQ